MRLHRTLVALLVFLASCGSSAASSTTAASSSGQPTASGPRGTHAGCGPAGAQTLAANTRVRVYSVQQVVYGCSVARGRSFRLGHATRSIAEPRVGPVALAGDLAAYGVQRFGVDTVLASVEVRRLTDGAVVKDLPAVTSPGPEALQSIGSIVVKGNGAVAWIGSQRSIVGGRRGVIEVHEAEANGHRVLDSGLGIDPGSLRLRGSTLTWRHGGGVRRATLR